MVDVDRAVDVARAEGVCEVAGVELSSAPRRPIAYKTLVKKMDFLPYGENTDKCARSRSWPRCRALAVLLSRNERDGHAKGLWEICSRIVFQMGLRKTADTNKSTPVPCGSWRSVDCAMQRRRGTAPVGIQPGMRMADARSYQ